MQPNPVNFGPVNAYVRAAVTTFSATDSVTFTLTPTSIVEQEGSAIWADGSTKFFAPVTGLYLADFSAVWGASATGQRMLRIFKNGSEVAGQSFDGHASFSQRQQVSRLLRLRASEYYEFKLETIGATVNASATLIVALVQLL
jgi:hypothetical protein